MTTSIVQSGSRLRLSCRSVQSIAAQNTKPQLSHFPLPKVKGLLTCPKTGSLAIRQVNGLPFGESFIPIVTLFSASSLVAPSQFPASPVRVLLFATLGMFAIRLSLPSYMFTSPSGYISLFFFFPNKNYSARYGITSSSCFHSFLATFSLASLFPESVNTRLVATTYL